MTPTSSPVVEPGRGAAFAVYALYLLSIPSAALFALVGVIVALTARADAGPLARAHMDSQIRIWFIAFWWAVGLALAALVGWLTLIILVGGLILWITGLLALGVMIWFTIKSLLGLLALIDGRPPR
jgi:uncharacterized membrane protein